MTTTVGRTLTLCVYNLLEEWFHEREHDSYEVGGMENVHFLDVLLVPENKTS